MEYTPDIASAWPNFSDHAIGVVAALHLADGEVTGGAVQVVADRLLGPGRYLGVFITTERDTPISRAKSFTKRYPELAGLGNAWEGIHAHDGALARVTLLELQATNVIGRARCSVRERSQQRVLVVARADTDLGRLAADLAADPMLRRPDFQPKGLVPWLLRAGLRNGTVIIVRPEDGTRGPGLGFYGRPEHIEQIRDALTTTLT